MADILNIVGEPIFDDRIVKFEFHTYNPYANTTFGHSDEIRIPIQQQDLYTLPCESFLYIEGTLTVKKKDEETPTTLDAHYEDVEFLRNIDACNTIRCVRHAKNCALQNVFKIFNWWSQHQE
ncbi:hypothetical protein ALC62_14751 [Cyphomyrmex costatus]|uniref:Uncharacterized protein n=1 Tax=Cyphomyrmex costatus TaxID=456900 RepID=A0A151I8E3_9HYME|nr:hypothetical protein ALC62_14751 [Cyphomyrmex costatus]